MEAGVGWVRLPLHHLVLLEQHDPLSGLERSGCFQRVGPVGVGIERDLGLAQHLPIPVVGEATVQLLPVRVTGASVLLDAIDVTIDVDRDNPEVVTLSLRHLLRRCHSEVMPSMLDDILVLVHGLVHDNPRRL